MTRKRIPIFVSLVLVFAGCDHAVKQLAQNTLAGSGPISLAADTIRFELAFNRGGFMSLGEALPHQLRDLVFVGFVPLMLLVVCVVALRSGLGSGGPLVGLALICGGGLANWLDRLLNGTVTDYMVLGVGWLRTGVFNLADVAIFAGAAVLLLVREQTRAEPGPDDASSSA